MRKEYVNKTISKKNVKIKPFAFYFTLVLMLGAIVHLSIPTQVTPGGTQTGITEKK